VTTKPGCLSILAWNRRWVAARRARYLDIQRMRFLAENQIDTCRCRKQTTAQKARDLPCGWSSLLSSFSLTKVQLLSLLDLLSPTLKMPKGRETDAATSETTAAVAMSEADVAVAAPHAQMDVLEEGNITFPHKVRRERRESVLRVSRYARRVRWREEKQRRSVACSEKDPLRRQQPQLLSDLLLIRLSYLLVSYFLLPRQLHEILSDENNSACIAWLPHGKGFQIVNKQR
jgi:hypothetical protein